MFSLLRNRYEGLRDQIGAAGLLVAVIALVAALGGSAIALTAADKKLVQKEAKKYAKQFAKPGAQGNPGAAGAQGLPGAAGAAGKDGADGQNGTDGSTILSGNQNPTTQGANGDFYIRTTTSQIWGPKVSGSWTGTGPTNLKGEDGEPWTADGTLPPGATETGTWAFFANGSGLGLAPISFPVPLESPLATSDVHLTSTTGGANCPGSAENPQAEPGHLCVYLVTSSSPGTLSIVDDVAIDGASVNGAFVANLLGDAAPGTGFAFGSWAVTAAP